MSFPINISELVHGKVVEWDRIEFKKGWNPDEVLRTVCAFANDLNNWGGGYIVIGVSADYGKPSFPAVGLSSAVVDQIQGELVRVCGQIHPGYAPIGRPYELEGKLIFLIWVPAGDLRPYSAPTANEDLFHREYYIRNASKTIIAQGENFRSLMNLTSRIPFDDRIHPEARLNDLDPALIREFLQTIGSGLFEESIQMPFAELCLEMQIVRGSLEDLRPVNAGLLFFNEEPERFFQNAWIVVYRHSIPEAGNSKEKIFKGPLHKQIRNCLNDLQNTVLHTVIKKQDPLAENQSVSNYPFQALEEALANAVYHKDYQDGKPVEIHVFPDRIEILSYPGPVSPIDNESLKMERIISRSNRNRRIGDFLKELGLTGGKTTGIPLIRKLMKENGSPEPEFYTDEDRTFFLLTLPCHSEWMKSEFLILP
jgi:ATP-dependent DNA helicase RecG